MTARLCLENEVRTLSKYQLNLPISFKASFLSESFCDKFISELLSSMKLGEREWTIWGGFLDGVNRDGSKTGDVQERD